MPRRSKYGNKKTEVDGITFDSKAEARRYVDLKLLEKAGQIGDLRLQPVYQLRGPRGGVVCKYIADFEYKELDKTGYAKRLVVEDVKGTRTRLFSLKAKLFADNFGFKITEVPA